jgi:hypothetical protein
MTDLMELASRVEAGESDTREIFEEAYTAIHGMSWQAAAYHHGSLGSEPDRAKQETAFRFGELVRVWAWLDAAMSLVPEEAFWKIENHPMYGFCGTVDDEQAFACTGPLTLAAAALRAIACRRESHDEQ